jgi:hypothetical protein
MGLGTTTAPQQLNSFYRNAGASDNNLGMVTGSRRMTRTMNPMKFNKISTQHHHHEQQQA